MTYSEQKPLLARVISTAILGLIAYLSAFQIIDREWFIGILFAASLPRLIIFVIRFYPWSKKFLVNPSNVYTYSEIRNFRIRLSQKDSFAKIEELNEGKKWTVFFSDKESGKIYFRSAQSVFGSNLYLSLSESGSETKVKMEWVEFSLWGNPQYRDSKITEFMNEFEESLVI